MPLTTGYEFGSHPLQFSGANNQNCLSSPLDDTTSGGAV